MNYDLESRTLKFSSDVLVLCKKTRLTTLNKNIIEQVLRSSTSIGANYCEALGSSSKKDFRNKIHICKKEAQETRYWLKLFYNVESVLESEITILIKESHELVLIFGKIASSSK